MNEIKNSNFKYFCFFLISVFIYFAHATYTRHAIYGDGNGYYSYSNALYFQQNLDLTKIYNHLSNFQGRNFIFSRIFWEQNYNPFTIGTAITWLPSFAVINVLNNIFNLGLTRFDLIYELGPGITGIVFVIFGLYFLEIYLKKHFPKKIVFWTILTLFFGTNIFYYSALEPALSHQPSFFIICFLLYWSINFSKTYANFLLLGIVSGLLGIIRMADVVFLIPIFYEIKPKLKDWIPVIVGFLAGISPQIFNQYLMFGDPTINPYLSGQNGTWSLSFIKIFEVLFSPKRGLLLWSPILVAAFAGLIIKKRFIYLATILLTLLIVSSWSAYLTAGFGHRMFFSALPFFAFGIAAIFKKLPVGFILLTMALCFGWNLLLLKNVYLHKDLFIQDSDFSHEEFFTHMVQFK